MRMKHFYLFTAIICLISSCSPQQKTEEPPTVDSTTVSRDSPTEVPAEVKNDHQLREVVKAHTPPEIDGDSSDAVWDSAIWYPLDQRWLGEAYSEEDFSGRFKVTWSSEALYLLVEIKDDVLFDQYEDPLKLWWDDDCVEIFVDEDNSGGKHQYTHNAFAYHVALDGNVVDMSPKGEGALYNDHVITKHITSGNTSLWEHKIYIYEDSYSEDSSNTPVTLQEGKKLGFMLAYCDNDSSKERENFIGSVFVPGEDKNQGYIDANVFGTLLLVDQ